MNNRGVFTVLFLVYVSTQLFGQHSQKVRGVVIDRLAETPIPYATVVILNTDPVLGATTDSMGRFSIARVPIGRYDLKASFVGYDPAILKEVVVNTAKETVVTFRMSENAIQLQEVVVKPDVNKTENINSMALVGGRLLSIEEASRFAGGMDDPARLASSFAGVTSTLGNNGIVVRGNAPKFLQWKMEDVEIPNPNHFADVTSFGGGGFTSLSSQVLGNSDFFTGAFPADYSNALSGVFDMNMRTGNSQSRENTIQIGTLGLDFASEGPFKKGYDGSYIINYRYSTLALLSSLMPEDAGGIRYQDLSFKISLPTKKCGAFALWDTGLIDRSGNDVEKDVDKWEFAQDKQNQDVKQYMGAFGIAHRIGLGANGYLKSTLAATISGLDMHTEEMDGNRVLQPKDVIKNTNWNFVFNTSFNKKFSSWHTNKSGIRLTGLSYNLLMKNAEVIGQPLQLVNDESGFSSLISGYSSSLFKIDEQWAINTGINISWFTLNNHYAIEPRLGVKWQFSPEIDFELAYGMHSRLEMLNYYFTKSADGQEINRDLDFTRAHHFSVAMDYSLGSDYHLKFEPYIQYLYNVPVIKDSTYSFINLSGKEDWFLTNNLSNDGVGLNYGIDITFEKFMSRGFYYLFTTSLFDSKYKTNIDKWFNTRYNRNYVLNLLVGKEWLVGKQKQNVININLKLSYQGGDRFTPVNDEASEAAQDVVYDATNPYSKQISPVLLGHISFGYKINRKSSSHEISLKVMNVTGYKEFYGYRFNFKKNIAEQEREAILIPSISYKYEF